MRRDQWMRAGGRARRTGRPIEVGEESCGRSEIGPRRSGALLRQPNRANPCEGACGGRRDPYKLPHPERLRAEQRVPASLDAHCQDVAVDHEARDHQEQVDADAESGQGEAVSNACLEPLDQPDI